MALTSVPKLVIDTLPGFAVAAGAVSGNQPANCRQVQPRGCRADRPT